MNARLAYVTAAAEVLAAARVDLSRAVHAARTPDPRTHRICSLRDIAAAANLAPETIRKIAATEAPE